MFMNHSNLWIRHKQQHLKQLWNPVTAKAFTLPMWVFTLSFRTGFEKSFAHKKCSFPTVYIFLKLTILSLTRRQPFQATMSSSLPWVKLKSCQVSLEGSLFKLWYPLAAWYKCNLGKMSIICIKLGMQTIKNPSSFYY